MRARSVPSHSPRARAAQREGRGLGRDAGLRLRVAVAQRGLRGPLFVAARHRAQRALRARDRGALNAQLLALRGYLTLELLARLVGLVEPGLERRNPALEVLQHARD